MLVFCIEGNIGSGKSTVIERLKKTFRGDEKVRFVDEPVAEWVRLGFLQAMYRGEVSRSAFQHMVLTSLAWSFTNECNTNPDVIICERSVWSNFHVFGKANLEGKELDMYKHAWRNIVETMPSMNVNYVYLHVGVDVLMERTKLRARVAEDTITQEYMQTLQNHLEFFFSDNECIRVDASATKNEVQQEIEDIIVIHRRMLCCKDRHSHEAARANYITMERASMGISYVSFILTSFLNALMRRCKIRSRAVLAVLLDIYKTLRPSNTS